MNSDWDVIIVPCLISGYINYANSSFKTFGIKPPTERAYFAQTPGADSSSGDLDNSTLKHDIFEDIRPAPYGSLGDSYRQTDERSGIYIHWSLPKYLRTGIVGSETSDPTVDLQKKKGGFPPTDDQPTGYGTPAYRHAPDSWIINRHVEAIGGGNLKIQNLNSSGGYDIADWKNASGQTATSVDDVFIVTSNYVRRPENMSGTEDVEVTCTPLGVPSKGQAYLGGSVKVADFVGRGSTAEIISLTPATTSNPFFLDYQPANAGVFSFFDNLRSTSGTTGQYSGVNVSFSVGGYHSYWSTSTTEPQFKYDAMNQQLAAITDAPQYATPNQSRRERIQALGLDLQDVGLTGWFFEERIASFSYPPASRMRSLLHGRLVNVAWQSATQNNIPDMANPADEVQTLFTNSHPLAVGTNAIDSFYAWLDSQKTSLNGNDALDTIKSQLLKLQSLVLDLNDDIDSQLQAQDLLATNNFIPSDRGTVWQFQPSNTSSASPIVPTSSDMALFSKLNIDQAFLDALNRQRKNLNSQLFSQWWIYASDRNGGASVTQVKTEVTRLVGLIQANIIAVAAVTARIAADKPIAAVKGGLAPAFYTQRDPTIMIAGCKNAWPLDPDTIIARTPQQTQGGGQNVSNPNLPPAKFPSDLWGPWYNIAPVFGGLIQEDIGYSKGTTNANVKVPHWYSTNKQDTYNGQNGWFPLFIEWEVEYYHIPFDRWEFAPQGPEGRYGYRLKSTTTGIANVANIRDDYRIIKGRTPILPQAAGALKTAITQVFSKVHPDDLNAIISPDLQTSLLSQLDAFDFLSTALTGFTTQLLTLMDGTHITPLDYSKPASPVTLAGTAATQINSDLGLTAATIALMQADMDLTPFASLVNVPADRSLYSPFKPVTHGQFRFKKFNIIDKFGQVVQGIRPGTDIKTSTTLGNTAIFPSLGDSYSLGALSNGTTADAVIQRPDSLTSFVQLPPSINQDARINAEFVVQDTNSYTTAKPSFKPINDWENPILGWIVINYPDYSIQVFSVTGQFIGEFGCANGVLETRPFPPAASVLQGLDPLLRDLCRKFGTVGYLQGIFATISRTLDNMKASPSEYSQSMLSTVGKPLALVRFGFSLQLGDLPFKNQSTIAPSGDARNSSTINKSVLDYQFDIKIGDKDNIFDGLYGYFAIDDLSKFFSYHDPTSITPKPAFIPSDPSVPMPTSYNISPFFTDPSALVASAVPAAQQSQEYLAQVNSHLNVFAALVNPHAPVHIYSALLPIKQLTLPPWAISQGLGRITSFFKAGPIIIPSINDPLPNSHVDINWVKNAGGDLTKLTPAGDIVVPSFNLGDWAWLQPFDYQNKGGTQYYVNNVVPPPTKPTWDPAPYAAVEGYLQMKTPLQKPDGA